MRDETVCYLRIKNCYLQKAVFIEREIPRFNIAYAWGFVIATCRLLSSSVCNFKFYWHFCAKLCEISVTFTLINIVCTSYFEILGENLGSILWYYIIEALDGFIFLEYIFQT